MEMNDGSFIPDGLGHHVSANEDRKRLEPGRNYLAKHTLRPKQVIDGLAGACNFWQAISRQLPIRAGCSFACMARPPCDVANLSQLFEAR